MCSDLDAIRAGGFCRTNRTVPLTSQISAPLVQNQESPASVDWIADVVGPRSDKAIGRAPRGPPQK